MNSFIFILLCFSIMILALVFGLIFPRIVKNSFIRFFIVAGIMFLAPAIIEYKMEDRDSRKYELLQTSIPIYSLKPTNRITGDFTLGFGSINNTDYYIFLVKRNDGFIRREVPINETLIIEKDAHPSIITNSIVKIRYFNRINGRQEKRDTLDYNSKGNEIVQPIKNEIIEPIKKDLGYKYIITIPKGSIMENQVYQVL